TVVAAEHVYGHDVTSAGPGNRSALRHLRRFLRRPDVEVEDRGRQVQRAARVRDVHDPRYPALDRRGSEQQIGLLARETELGQVLDRVQARPAVGDGSIQVVVLAAGLVHRHADEREEFAVTWLDATRYKNGGRRYAVLVHTVLDEVDTEVDVPAHLDGTAEGDLAVTLREVKVAAGEHAARNVHRIINAAATGEVLDVVVAAVLAGRDRASAFPADTLEFRTRRRAGQDPLLERWQGQGRHPVRLAVDQCLLAAVPLRQQCRRRRRPEQPGVRDAGVPDSRKVPRRGLLTA